MKQLFSLLILFVLIYFPACSKHSDSDIVWKFKTGYPMTGPPIVVKDRVFFGSDKFYCLNAETGEKLWEFSTFSNVKTAAVYHNNRIYFQCGGLYCLEADTGKLVWEFWNDQWADFPPVITNKYAYVIVKKQLRCIDIKTGKKRWELKIGVQKPYVAASGNHVFLHFNNKFFCLNASDGKKVWELSSSKKPFFMSAAHSHLYYGYRNENTIYCLDEKTGNKRWECLLDSSLKSIIPEKNMLFFSSNKVGSIEINTGKKIWETDLKTETFMMPMQNFEKHIYPQTLKRRLFCLDADSGRLLWDMKIRARFPAASKDYVYSRSINYFLYCLTPSKTKNN